MFVVKWIHRESLHLIDLKFLDSSLYKRVGLVQRLFNSSENVLNNFNALFSDHWKFLFVCFSARFKLNFYVKPACEHKLAICVLSSIVSPRKPIMLSVWCWANTSFWWSNWRYTRKALFYHSSSLGVCYLWVAGLNMLNIAQYSM